MVLQQSRKLSSETVCGFKSLALLRGRSSVAAAPGFGPGYDGPIPSDPICLGGRGARHPVATRKGRRFDSDPRFWKVGRVVMQRVANPSSSDRARGFNASTFRFCVGRSSTGRAPDCDSGTVGVRFSSVNLEDCVNGKRPDLKSEVIREGVWVRLLRLPRWVSSSNW